MAETPRGTGVPSPRLTRGILAVVLLGLLVACGFALWGDVPAVAHAMLTLSPLYLVLALALTTWNYALRWLKWHWYLHVLEVKGLSRGESVLVFLSAFTLGLTPAKAGELSKSYWLRELAGAERAPFARTAPIIFAERLTDGLAMLVLASAGLAVYQFGAPALLLSGGLALGAVCLVRTEAVARCGLRLLGRLGPTRKLAISLAVAYQSARALLTWRRLTLGVLIGVASWAGECVALYAILVGLGAVPGLELVNQATFALTAATLVGSASLLPGGLGAAEGLVAGILQTIAGQPRDTAVAATLLIRLCTLWFGVVLGAISLPILARRLRRVDQTRDVGPGSSMRAYFNQPFGRIWLRGIARVLEILSDVQPRSVDCSTIDAHLAVGGAFRASELHHLQARGITAVVDCRSEARDDAALLQRSGIAFLHLPAPDKHAMTFEQLRVGVEWVLQHLATGGRAFLHCEHGVGRGPLIACAVLVAQGQSAEEAVRIVRAHRWQALPNDRQLRALLAFEADWHRSLAAPAAQPGAAR